MLAFFGHLRVNQKIFFQHSIENSLNTVRSPTIFYNQRNPKIIVKRKKRFHRSFQKHIFVKHTLRFINNKNWKIEFKT